MTMDWGCQFFSSAWTKLLRQSCIHMKYRELLATNFHFDHCSGIDFLDPPKPRHVDYNLTKLYLNFSL